MNTMKKLLSLCLTFILIVSCITISVSAAAPIIENIAVDGISMDAAPGEFVITFDSAITNDTISSIKFTKEDGTEIKGGSFIEKSKEAPTKAVVKYGALERGANYKLTVGADSKTYTASSYYFKEDFEEGYVDGDLLESRPSGTLSEDLIYYPDTTEAFGGKARTPNSVHSIVEENGDTFIRMDLNKRGTIVPATSNDNGRIVLEFKEPITIGKFAARIKVRAQGSASQLKFLIPGYESNAALSNFFRMGQFVSGMVKKETDTAQLKGTLTGVEKFTKTGEHGFYDIQIAFLKDTSNKYTQTMTNLNALEEGEIKLVGNTAYPRGIKAFWLTQFYDKNESSATIDVSEIEIMEIYDTNILATDFESMTGDTFNVVFTNEISEQTLKDVTLKNGDSLVKLSYVEDSYSDDTRQASFKIGEILEPGTSYTLSFAGIRDTFGRSLGAESQTLSVASAPDDYTMSAPIIKNESQQVIEQIGDAASLSYETTVTAEAGKKFTLALIVMSKVDNRVLWANSDTKEVALGNSSVTLKVTTPETIDIGTSNCYVKPLIWCDDATMEALLLNAPDIIE